MLDRKLENRMGRWSFDLAALKMQRSRQIEEKKIAALLLCETEVSDSTLFNTYTKKLYDRVIKFKLS